MTTLLTIPKATALHIPAPGVAPVPLAHGDLTLAVIAAEEGTAAAKAGQDTVALTVGASSFVLARNAPVQRTRSQGEHPSFVFTPAPVGGKSIGQVRIDMADSPNPDAWESTEALCKALVAELKAHNLWTEKELFVDDEYETGGPRTDPEPGWGEWTAGLFSSLASRITGQPAASQELPTHTPAAASGITSTSPTARSATSPTSQDDIRAMTDRFASQATIAAKAAGSAAVAVGGAVAQQARHAVDSLASPTAPAPTLPDKDAPSPPAKDADADITDAKASPTADASAVQAAKVDTVEEARDAIAAPSAPTSAPKPKDEVKDEVDAIKVGETTEPESPKKAAREREAVPA